MLNPADWLLTRWARMLGHVIESMSGERPDIVPGDGRPEGMPEQQWWRQSLDLAPGSEIWFGCPPAAWMEVGRRGLLAAGIEEPEAGDIRSTFGEVLSQTGASLAQALTLELGRETTLTAVAEEPRAPETAEFRTVDVRFGDSRLPPCSLAFSAPLIEALSDREEDGDAVRRSGAPAESAGDSKTFDVLLEVEMPVSISFGRVQLPLREVLKLTTGSIVELNRAVSEPVEVIVNNCVVARGEVVVVEGNYGVRIQQIISPKERLRTLH